MINPVYHWQTIVGSLRHLFVFFLNEQCTCILLVPVEIRMDCMRNERNQACSTAFKIHNHCCKAPCPLRTFFVLFLLHFMTWCLFWFNFIPFSEMKMITLILLLNGFSFLVGCWFFFAVRIVVVGFATIYIAVVA